MATDFTVAADHLVDAGDVLFEPVSRRGDLAALQEYIPNMPAITGASHVAFTVTDVERSSAWYCDVLGLVPAFGGNDDVVSYRVLAHPDSGWVIGLRQYHAQPGDRFSEFRTGLDHLAFTVGDRAELEAWEADFRRRGDIEFSPIADTSLASLIVFRDPDGIQLELWLPSG